MSAEEVQLPSQSALSALPLSTPGPGANIGPNIGPTSVHSAHSVQSETPAPTESDETDDLMLRWENICKIMIKEKLMSTLFCF